MKKNPEKRITRFDRTTRFDWYAKYIIKLDTDQGYDSLYSVLRRDLTAAQHNPAIEAAGLWQDAVTERVEYVEIEGKKCWPPDYEIRLAVKKYGQQLESILRNKKVRILNAKLYD